MVNGIDARHNKGLKYDVFCISRCLYQCYSNNFYFVVVAIAHLVKRTDSAVLGGVVELVSSIPAVRHKNIFQHFPAYLSNYISLHIKLHYIQDIYILRQIPNIFQRM